jgi:AcrR family transcriptional regulator
LEILLVAKTSRRAAPRPYHHGNLVPALIDAALALLGETQDWAFSLREVARRAGVSHNAPYKHFPEKRDLLAAVAARGFEGLAQRMGAAVADAAEAAGARGRILACGRAYVRHGVQNPALYRLMFGPALTSAEAGRPAVEKEAGGKAKAILEEALTAGVRSGALPAALANPRAHAAATLAVWSNLHGLTMMAIDDYIGPAADVETLVDPIVGALLDGICAHPPAIPQRIWIAPRSST